MKNIQLNTLVSAWAIISSPLLFSLPKEAEVASGVADISAKESGQLHIHTSHKTIINWKEFSIDHKELVQFHQPQINSAVLNRVKGGNPSKILGQLIANGKVYLINPSGVIFGKDAIIQTADFLASTHDIADNAFLLDKELLFKGDSKEAIINYGTIKTSNGNVILIGRIVDNQGTISAPQGKVSLAAGQEILIKPEDIPILTIRPTQNPDGKITQEGRVEALIAELQAEGQAYTHGINIKGAVVALNTVEKNGEIYLKADSIAIAPSGTVEASYIAIDASKDLYQEGSIKAESGLVDIKAGPQGIYNLGTIDAGGSSGGQITIDAGLFTNHGKILAEGTSQDGGNINIHTHGPYVETRSGILSAAGQNLGGTITLNSDTTLFSSGAHHSQGDQGGTISLFASTINLVGAKLDATGQNLGGEIFVGGKAHGEPSDFPNARTTHLSGNTHLNASSSSGDGGTIVVWADEKTVTYGAIEANGGQGRKGGWIETSGKEELYCGAILSANAAHGTPGTVLLDPKNVIIDTVSGVYPQYELLDPSPSAGTGFGTAIVPLSTGNVVVTKPGYNPGALANVGAVYLYDGNTAELISILTGTQASDSVGGSGITALGNGNYVVSSYNWKNVGNGGAGAATWGNGAAGTTGAVSVSNS